MASETNAQGIPPPAIPPREPDVHEQPSSAPNSSEADEDEVVVEDNSSVDAANESFDEEDSSDEETDSAGDSTDTVPSEPGLTRSVEDIPGPSHREERDAGSSTDGYSFSGGPGIIDVEIRPPLSVPRVYSWVSEKVLQTRSVFVAGSDMSFVVRKITSRRRGIWNAEGMNAEDHAAVWSSELKFVMYDVVISTMNVRPPFTSFQQSVLGVLGLAPSQLHPNAWAFMRAYELVCLHLSRPISIDLFFHLFEVNRNTERGSPGRQHVSLRSAKKLRIFRLYSDSLKGNWKDRFYFVQPVDEKAIGFVGKYTADGRSLESAKFQLGWSLSHFNLSPSSYKVTETKLSTEDLQTRNLLMACADLLPFSRDENRRGFNTAELVRAATKTAVMNALDNMCGDEDFEWLTAMAGGLENAEGGIGAQTDAGVEDLVINVEDSPTGGVGKETALRVSPVNTVTQSDLERGKADQKGPDSVGMPQRPISKTAPQKPPKRKSGDAGGESSVVKRHKSSRRRRSSSSIPLDSEFVRRNFETYSADPIAASVNVFQNLGEIVKAQKEEADARVKAAEEERDREKGLKNQLQTRLEEVTKQNTKNRSELIQLQKYRADTELEKEEHKLLVTQLQAKISELESKISVSAEEIRTLRAQVAKLEGAPRPDSSARVVELEAELAKQKENVKRAANYALGMRQKGFLKALDQVYVVNPGMRSVGDGSFNVDYEVEDGKIVKVDKAQKTRMVVYPPGASGI